MPGLEARPLIDQVEAAVRRSILSGEYKPGYSVKIREVARDLGVSHIPVREAFQRLHSQGLLELRPGRSAVVAPLDLADLGEIFRIRALLEPDAAARAVTKLSQSDVEAIGEALDAMDTRNDQTFWAAHEQFHTLLLAPALSPRLSRMLAELTHAAERYVRLVFDGNGPAHLADVVERHGAVLRAVRSREPTAVQKALRSHIEGNVEVILEALRQSNATGPDDD